MQTCREETHSLFMIRTSVRIHSKSMWMQSRGQERALESILKDQSYRRCMMLTWARPAVAKPLCLMPSASQYPLEYGLTSKPSNFLLTNLRVRVPFDLQEWQFGAVSPWYLCTAFKSGWIAAEKLTRKNSERAVNYVCCKNAGRTMVRTWPSLYALLPLSVWVTLLLTCSLLPRWMHQIQNCAYPTFMCHSCCMCGLLCQIGHHKTNLDATFKYNSSEVYHYTSTDDWDVPGVVSM